MNQPLPPLHKAIAALAENTTQEAFAERVGTTRGRVNRWVNGRETPALPNLRKLVAAGLDARYLTGEALEDNPNDGRAA